MTSNRRLLAIECSTMYGSIAVGGATGTLAELSISAGRGSGRTAPTSRAGHSSALLPMIEAALSLAAWTPGDLDGVVVGAGPGSFTGVRIAAATAKGLVHALGVPLLAYSSLAAAAGAWNLRSSTVCAMFDARGRDVFAGIYRFDEASPTVVGPAALDLDEAIRLCREWQVDVITGDAVLRHREEVERRTDSSVAPAHLVQPRAATLLWLASNYAEEGEVPDPFTWEPDYLRASGAERIARANAS